MRAPTVSLFHAVDTEGPLFEAPADTVARINRTAGLALPETESTYEKLLTRKIDLGSAAEIVERILRYSVFLGDWTAVRNMLRYIMSDEFRRANADSNGRPWRYNWHIMDHVGYEVNPRHRDIGFHNVFDVYRGLVATPNCPDQLGFHFHPEHFYAHAHLCGSTYSASRSLYQILARKLIDRNWFPRSFRAGFHTERPDSHMFLEQWIPHDFSNQAIRDDQSTVGQLDLSDHRFGDWSRAPTEWGWYSPDHDDYQRPGRCRRRIFRCLNIGTRHRCIDEDGLRAAFTQAHSSGRDVVVGVTNHDFRDMAPDVEWLKSALDRISAETRIAWRSASIDDTFEPWRGPPVRSKWNLDDASKLGRLTVEYDSEIFGPQPFMAVKLFNELYFHVNFDIVKPFRAFSYCFDENTVPLSRVESIVVGTNDRRGNVIIDRIKG